VPFISYAQNGEDVLLRRVYPQGPQGFYIDVGAAHPINNSVTKHFYERGWHGINVEPTSGFFAKIAADRLRDRNLNIGLSDRPGKMELYEVPNQLDLTSMSATQADIHRRAGYEVVKTVVPVSTLATICEDYGVTEIDFLSIDVEGHEPQVIAGGDWRRWRPRVVLVEATLPLTLTPCHDRWEHLLLAVDYRYAAFDGLNRYYVRAEDSHLIGVLSPPITIVDDVLPFRYHRQIEELRQRCQDAEKLTTELTACQANLQQLNRQHQTSLTELVSTYRELVATREQLFLTRSELERAHSQLKPLLDLGPRSLRLARWLRRMSTTHPSMARVIKKVFHAPPVNS